MADLRDVLEWLGPHIPHVNMPSNIPPKCPLYWPWQKTGICQRTEGVFRSSRNSPG